MTYYQSKRKLSPTEKRVAWLVATHGLSNKELGAYLRIPEGTVKVHLKGILHVLKLNNRTQIAVVGWRDGLRAEWESYILADDATLQILRRAAQVRRANENQSA